MTGFSALSELSLGSSTVGLPSASGFINVGISSELSGLGVVSVAVLNDVVFDIDNITTVIFQSVYEGGQISVVIAIEVPHFIGALPATTLEYELFTTAVPIEVFLRQTAYGKGSVQAGLQVDTTETVFTIIANTALEVYESSSILAVIGQSIFNASAGAQEDPSGLLIPAGLVSYSQSTPVQGTPTKQTGYWTASVILDGVDVSVNLTGTILVDREESAAAVAEFTLKPTAGLVDLTQWVNASVDITYQVTDSSGVPLTDYLLFKGFVDVPTYDPESRLTTFSCTDQLQRAFESKTTEEINLIVGGFWDKNIFSEDVDKWTYANDRLSTIPFSLDYSISNAIVLTPWKAKSIPDFTVNETVVLESSIAVTVANARSLINTVLLDTSYQQDIFKEVVLNRGWAMNPSVPDGAANYGITFLTFQAILDAASAEGWVFKGPPAFTSFPPSGFYAGMGVLNTDPKLVVGATWTNVIRYRQFSNVVLNTKIFSQKSVDSLGVLEEIQSFSLSAEYSEQADRFTDTEEGTGTYTATLNTHFAEGFSENGDPINPSFIGETPVSFKYPTYQKTHPIARVAGKDNIVDSNSFITNNTKADYEAGIAVLLNKGKTDILSSHRANSVDISMLIEPRLDRIHTLAIDTGTVKAMGKVAQVRHTLNIEQGSAITVATIAVSRSTGVGIPEIETPLNSTADVAPPLISSGSALFPGLHTWFEPRDGPIPVAFGMRAFNSRTEFLVNFPEVQASAVAEITSESSQEFVVDIPDEQFILSV